jgi:hypothetical protein
MVSIAQRSWSNIDLELNRMAFEMAKAEFTYDAGHPPETLLELQTIWRRQSVILRTLK